MEEIDDQEVEIQAAQQALTGCVPGPRQISVFVHINYGGDCVTLNVGRYPRASGTGFLPNDSISSVKVGSEVYMKACDHADWGGTCQRFPANANMTTYGFNDTISSIEVAPWDIDTDSSATLWKNSSGPGYENLTSFLTPGNYPNAGSMGIPNDSLSAIYVGSNVNLQLCRDSNYLGFCQWFSGPMSVADMRNTSVGNDTVSSAKVVRK